MTPASGRTRQATAAVRTAGRGMAPDPARPTAHFRPAAGWMNDPNGTIHHRGVYHLFYQHNPYDDRWGDIHWGHATSPDLVRWEHRPVALAPSAAAGEAHCFTGSAWKRPGDEPVLFYSSFPGDLSERPAEQWLVECDTEMTEFRKWEGNPLLSLESHDGPVLDPDWRDPFVFREDGRVFMILGATLAASGAPVVPLYEATDPALTDWTFRGILHRGDPAEYAFFECPVLVPVGDRHALLYSAHRPVEWVLGRFDPQTASLEPTDRGRLDRSPNLYGTASVAFAPGPHPVVVGWVRGWEPDRGWNGCLSLPRVIRPGPDGRPLQAPAPPVADLREGEGTRRDDLRPGDGTDAVTLPDLRAPALEARARIRPHRGPCGLRLRRPENGEVIVALRLRPDQGILEVTGRSHPVDLRPGEPPVPARSEVREETTPVPLPGERDRAIELRLFWDRSLLELFVDGGREVCTRVMATRGDPVEVEAFSEKGAARFDALEGWPLEEIW